MHSHISQIIRAGALLAVVAPVMASAQQGGRLRVSTIERKPLNGACASLAGVPSELSRSPEGLALLRFKRELDGAATVFEQRGSTMEGMDAKRMFEMRRGVDSLMRVFVRYRNPDSVAAGSAAGAPSVRRDSMIIVDGRRVEGRAVSESMETAIKAIRPNIEITLRALDPQFAAGGVRAASAAPVTGYIGMTLSGAQIRMMSDSGNFTAHCDYPMIEAVDVGSPARKAGLAAGDTVIAYNGRDVVAQTVNYPQLLVPGKTVKVRVHRDGKSREVAVAVTERPLELAEHNVRWVPAPGTMRTPLPGGVMTGGVMLPARAPTGGSGSASGPQGGVIVRTVPAIPGMISPGAVSGSAAMFSAFGATMNAIDEEFAQALNIEQGVLVMRVVPGSLAAEAGLRTGEIIRAVNGAPVRELLPIQRAIAIPGARDVKLTVSGKDTPARIVTIRW